MSMPWASGENAIAPTCSRASTSSRPSSTQDVYGLRRPLRRVGADADVQRLALAHRRVKRPHRFLERCDRVDAVGVEDVDVLQPHSREALLEAREQVFARAEVAVWPGPLVIARLGRDDQLLAIRSEVLREYAPEVGFGATVGRPVVVREIKMGNAELERAAQNRAAVGQRPIVAEVLPETQ